MKQERDMSRHNCLLKIRQLFASDDQEMWKLGRLLCHQYRIDYQVVIDHNKRWYTHPVCIVKAYMVKNSYTRVSMRGDKRLLIYDEQHRFLKEVIGSQLKVYKIKLCRH